MPLSPHAHALTRMRLSAMLLAWSVLVPWGSLAAQREPIPFRQITSADGLSQNAISAILQDHRGFMWFGTKEGLNRYDGYDFVVFRHTPFDDRTISDSDVSALLEDGRGRLWAGTRNGALNAFDPVTETFERHLPESTQPITGLAEDRDGESLWVATDGGGLYRYFPESRTAVPFRHDATDAASLSHDRAYAVLVDRTGTVWVGTRTGLDRFDPSVAGPGSFTRFRAGPPDRLGIIDSTVSALHEDRQGRLWIGSVPGLSVLSPGRDRIEHHYHRYRAERYGWGLPKQLLMDRSGRLWISTYSELMLFDPGTATFSYERHDPLRPGGINSNQPTALFQDRSDVIWVGTNGSGINVHDPKATRFHTFRRLPGQPSRLTQFSVYTLFEDSQERVWIDAGLLYRWDRRTGELRSFETSSDRHDDFGNTGVWSILEDPPGFLWAGSYQGLFHYEIATERARLYEPEPGRPGSLPERNVKEVYRTRDGTLWVMTENYLAKLVDPEGGRFEVYPYTDPPTQDEWTFPSIHEDGNGVLWIGSHQGLVRFDPATGELRRFRNRPRDPASLSHDVVGALCPDPRSPDRYLWVSTLGGGLNRLDLLEERFHHFTVEDGLANNVVYGILPDDSGSLWLSTNHGLSRFDPGTERFRNYDRSDGLQGNEFNSGAYYRSASGELFFGGLFGFSHFRPEEVRDNPVIPPVVLTAFRRANRYESVRDSGTVLPASISRLELLRLSHRDNAIGFDFAALDYSAPEKNRYAYRLLGFQDEWVDAGPQRSATYTHLPPGRYTLQVKGSNNDGVWNETGTSLAIRIVPPWWRTPWAYALWLALALGLLYVLRRYEMSRVELKNRLQLERVEAEKLREVDQARGRLFANVSHEFRTPLTLTLGPLDDLLEGLHGTLLPVVRAQVALARRNAGRVLDLVNQILDLARLEAGGTPLRAHAIELGAFVAGVCDAFEPLARRRSLRLEVIRPHEPLVLAADPEHLEKALSNLLSNALKFTPEGGSVRVSVEADPESARIAVRDSGAGIPAEHMPRVFDRFYRVEGPDRVQSGTGIGLALARELVELHGGSLRAESEEGFGSTFTITLPRPGADGTTHGRPGEAVATLRPLPPSVRALFPRRAVLADEAADAPGVQNVGELEDGAIESDEEDRTTVLVVEDSEEVRRYLRMHLSRDYRVLEAADGERGLALVREALPDLVISDIMMPGRDGLGLCRAIKKDPETDFIPVVLLTARAGPEDRVTGLKEEADDYLVKPFRSDELLARVANLIASRKRLRERFAEGTDRTPTLSLPGIESADQRFLDQVLAAIEKHLDDETYTVERLARDVAHSRGHLHRRLRALVDESPSDLIRRLRLERAAGLLEAGAGSVSSIAYSVGFKSVSHFSNRFLEQFGVRPSAWGSKTTG